MRIIILNFLLISIAGNIFYHPLNLSLYVSLGLKWVYCGQHVYIYMYLFFISIERVCAFLVDHCNPFVFTVGIHAYLNFLNCFGFIFMSFLVFPPYRSPFNICCKVRLVMLNSLIFCLCIKLLISSSILNEILDGQSNLHYRIVEFFLLVL